MDASDPNERLSFEIITYLIHEKRREGFNSPPSHYLTNI